MSKIVRTWIIGLSLLLILVGTATSDIPKITVEIYPANLKLPIEGNAEATLVVRNPTELAAKDVRISFTEIPGVDITIKPSITQTIQSKGAFAWSIILNQVENSIISGDVNFQIYYKLVDEEGTEINDVLFTKLEVSSQEHENPPQIVAVTVHSALTELNDFRPGYIYLKVENKSAAPIEITDIIVSERPDFILLKPSINATPLPPEESRISYGDSAKIPAGESKIYPIYVSSSDQVQPGDHMLLFNVVYQRNVNGKIQTGSVVVEKQIKVKVFGEDEVLGALANVTTFLFVPGFLMVVIAGIFWKLLVPQSRKQQFPFNLTATTFADPRFWVTVITLSLVMAWQVYPAVTARISLIGRRDFLYGYGFQDIVWMWLLSILFGFIFSLLAAIIVSIEEKNAARKIKTEHDKKIKPTDYPVVVLEKIHKLGFDEIRFLEANVKDTNQKGFLIEKDEPGKTIFFLAPKIMIWYSQDASELRDQTAKLIEQEDETLGKLLTLLKEGLELGETGIVKIDWTGEGGFIDKIIEVNKDNLNISTSKKDIFIHEWHT